MISAGCQVMGCWSSWMTASKGYNHNTFTSQWLSSNTRISPVAQFAPIILPSINASCFVFLVALIFPTRYLGIYLCSSPFKSSKSLSLSMEVISWRWGACVLSMTMHCPEQGQHSFAVETNNNTRNYHISQVKTFLYMLLSLCLTNLYGRPSSYILKACIWESKCLNSWSFSLEIISN